MKRIRVLLVALMLSVALAPSLRASGPLSVLMKPPGTAPTTLLPNALPGVTPSATTGLYTVTDASSVQALLRTGWQIVYNPLLAGANGNTVGGCTWTVTLSSGAGTSTQTACLAQCSNVNVLGVSSLLAGGTPTTLATPTSAAQNAECAQPSSGATVVKCLSSNGSASNVITGNCGN